MSGSPTYVDIQELTGLSLSTISKYFNGGNVRERNRITIEDAVARLGYQVNQHARSLRAGRSSTVGVLLPDFGQSSAFHLSIIGGTEEILRSRGIGLIVSTAGARPSGVDFLRARMVDGIIAVPDPRDEAELKAAVARDIPVVLIDRLIDDVDTDAVVLDNRHAVRIAVDALVEQGHERIALICGTDEIWALRERAAGFDEALRAHGITPRPRLIRRGPLTAEFGDLAVQSLMGGDEEIPPTAIVCANDALTRGAMGAVVRLGIHVPDTLSVIGFDAEEIADVTTPPLHYVHQPTRQIAEEAAQLMIRTLNDESARSARTVVLRARLVAGRSIAAPSGTEPHA
ncbi:LacI family transcriptional regulator [Agromyces rhizosphaerae]|uniref:LacI family transcriptional regulator n=1 Tax=Agromyces rhizosphaerae TaxID=88374 RepID=A0A9W6CWS3_9MICO|nr:LacI family DNA-binding transcriptional regulator [Agromyces rhizosphaerae]GLI26662.1 LacI family transcriptional regulator [Agromyces rhizosphaerae]